MNKSKQARKRILPISVGVTMGIVLGVALDNIAIGLAIGIVLAGIVIAWRKRS